MVSVCPKFDSVVAGVLMGTYIRTLKQTEVMCLLTLEIYGERNEKVCESCFP